MKLKAAIIAIFLFVSWAVHGQQSAFVQYNTGDGLAQSQVRAMAWDDHGYLWFGTLGGLSRFDGYEFVNFTKDRGLPDNQINAILSGTKLWIGTTGAIAFVDGRGIESIPFPPSFVASKISDMAESKDGTLWLALAGDGLLEYSRGAFRHYGLSDGLPDNYVRSLAFDAENRLWVGTRTGVVWIENEVLQPSPFDELKGVSVAEIAKGRDGEMIVCTFGHGVFIAEEDRILRYTTDDGLASNDIRCAEQTGPGEYWFGSREGLSRKNADGFTLFDEKKGMPYANVKSLATDREGNLWIGTDGQGVLRRTGRPFTYYSTEDGLLSNPVMDICESDTGGLVFATYDRGISLFNGKSFSAYPYNHLLPSSTVWQVAVSASNVLYAATSGGLFIEDDGEVTIIDSQDGLPGDRITALQMDINGMGIWIGAEDGFAQLSLEGKILRKIDAKDGFPGRRIRNLLQTDDALWIAAEGEVYRLDLEGNNWTRLPNFLEPETAVYSLVFDAKGALWIGTAAGLFVWMPDDDRPTEVEYTETFSGQNVNWLATREDGDLMIGTNNGIYKLQLNAFHQSAETKVKHYSAYEGLVSSETNQNAVLVVDSEIWFGTTMGAVRYAPSVETSQIHTAPMLNISDLQLFLENVDWTSRGDSISALTGLPVDLTLNHDANYLSFNYAGIYFSNPHKVRYRYKLDGVDPHWLGPTKSRTATYAYLPPGNYHFVVQAFQIDDPELITEKIFSFSITPPFYLTSWFFVLTGLVILGLIYLIYRGRLAQERKKQTALRMEMQTKMMQLETRSLNSSMNRHFIFNALNSIQYYINMQDRRSANRYLTNFAKLIRKNLDTSQQMKTSLREELERLELYLSLEKMRFHDRFEYRIEVADGIDPENIDIPAMLLQPFLENSIWHGILPSDRFGRVTVKVENAPDAHLVVIEDDGIGIDTSLRNKNGRDIDENHVSQGVNITVNRIRLYKNLTGRDYSVDGPMDRHPTEGHRGTKVVIHLPKE